MPINHFTQIECWKLGRLLSYNVYKLTEVYPKTEIFGLTSQMRRSAISVPANIAEGFKRKGVRDKLRFYNIADASLAELQTYFYLSSDLGYISIKDRDELMSKSEKVGRVLGGWILSQK